MSDLPPTVPPPPTLDLWVDPAQVTDILGAPATHIELLTHNPLNAVTGGIWRVEAGDRRAVVKILTDGTGHEGPNWWAASTEPTHWNWWCREADVYREDLARWFRPHGVDAPRLLHLASRDVSAPADRGDPGNQTSQGNQTDRRTDQTSQGNQTDHRTDRDGPSDDRLRRRDDAPHEDLADPGDRGGRRDGAAVLWLEWVDGTSGADLGIDGLADFARSLGRAQAGLADDGPGAAVRRGTPWLSRNFLREYSESKPEVGALLEDDRLWATPLVAEHLGHLREPLTRLHRHRDELLAIAERCPRTLCHLDVWPANVTRRPDGSYVLFDWAFCGDGALGEDVANLIPDSVFDLLHPADALDELAATVESSYVAGVREGGWEGDERWLKLGIRAAAVKYHWLVGSLLRDVSDGPRKVYGGRPVPAEDLYRARATGLALLCRWADEARELT